MTKLVATYWQIQARSSGCGAMPAFRPDMAWSRPTPVWRFAAARQLAPKGNITRLSMGQEGVAGPRAEAATDIRLASRLHSASARRGRLSPLRESDEQTHRCRAE